MNTFLSLFRICSDKFKIKGFSALKFTRVIIPEYTLPVSCSKPNQRSSLPWAGSGKAHQCHLCSFTLITQHFHFILANLILRLTHVFKIFAEKYFQSIKIYRNLPDLKFISYLQNLYFEFLVLLSNLEKIKSLSLSLLESGKSFKKFLFLLSNLEKWNPFLFLFSKLENIFSNFSFSSRLDFFASRCSVCLVTQRSKRDRVQ